MSPDISERILRAETNADVARRNAIEARNAGQPDLHLAYTDQTIAYEMLAQALRDELQGGIK